MIDLRLVREHPDVVRASQRARGADESLVDALLAADEVFVTSTIREVMAVTSLVLLERGAPEIRVVADGKPGPVTRRLHAAFRRHVERTHLQ